MFEKKCGCSLSSIDSFAPRSIGLSRSPMRCSDNPASHAAAKAGWTFFIVSPPPPTRLAAASGLTPQTEGLKAILPLAGGLADDAPVGAICAHVLSLEGKRAA
jgi:hypothetical protein